MPSEVKHDEEEVLDQSDDEDADDENDDDDDAEETCRCSKCQRMLKLCGYPVDDYFQFEVKHISFEVLVTVVKFNGIYFTYLKATWFYIISFELDRVVVADAVCVCDLPLAFTFMMLFLKNVSSAYVRVNSEA